MLRFLPREEKFFSLFSELADNIVKAAELLKEIVVNQIDAEITAQSIKKLEHINDHLTHEIVNKLNKTFITPFDREDIYLLSMKLDDVIDYIESAASLIVIYKIKTFTNEIQSLADIIVKSAKQVQAGIMELHQIHHVLPICIEINRLENEADAVFRQGLAKLFEGTVDTINIIKLKDLYDDMELATDRCEDVANILETIAVKNQ